MPPRELPRASLLLALASSCAFASPDDPAPDVRDATDVPARPDAVADARPDARPDVVDASARMDVADVPVALPDVIDVPLALPDVIDVPVTLPDVVDVPLARPDVIDVPVALPDVVDAPAPSPFPLRVGGDGTDEGAAVAWDPAGHVVAGAQFTGTISLGGNAIASLGGSDGVLLSVDAAGAVRWSQRVGSSAGDTLAHVSVDPDGNVYACGSVGGAAVIGGASIRPPDAAADGWVASWSRDGALRWVTALTGAGAQHPLRVAAEVSGTVWVAGQFDTALSVSGMTGTPRGGTDVFLVRLAAGTGSPALLRVFGTAGAETLAGLAARAGRGLVLGMNHNGGVDVGVAVPSAGATDGLVARFDPNGAYLGHHTVTSPGADSVTAVALDDTGGACAAGTSFNAEVLVGSARVPLGFADVFVACFAADGTTRWAIPITGSSPSSSAERVRSLATGVDGTVWAAGETGAGVLTLGPRTATGPGVTAGFVARFDRAGTALALEVATGASTFAAVAVADRDFALAGGVDASGTFAGLSLRGTGTRDGFVLRAPR